jgi:DMSO/TMAO reductase YedYZ molybdopterin-dependent catalytic subunit
MVLDFSDLEKLGIEDYVFDIHCVTSWSRLDQPFRGVDFAKIIALVTPKNTVKHVIFESRNDGYSTNVRFDEILRNPVIIATEIDNQAIPLMYG